MGAKPLSVSQRQVTAILKGAEKAGQHLQIIAEKGRVRFLPSEKPADSYDVDSEVKGHL